MCAFSVVFYSTLYVSARTNSPYIFDVFNIYFSDAGGTIAAEGATYSAPVDIPYKFSMVANVKGFHKVLAVTSNNDKLKVETIDDKSTSVGISNSIHLTILAIESCVFVMGILQNIEYSDTATIKDPHRSYLGNLSLHFRIFFTRAG